VALQAEQEQLVNHWPHPLKNDGKVRVMIRTAQGLAVPVRVTSTFTAARAKGERQALCWCVCWPGSVRNLRSLHPGRWLQR